MHGVKYFFSDGINDNRISLALKQFSSKFIMWQRYKTEMINIRQIAYKTEMTNIR